MSCEQCPGGKSNKLCFNCAYPIAECPWLHEGKPVPGWTAEKTRVGVGNVKKGEKRGTDETYHITACPLHVPYPKERYKQDNTDPQNWGRTFYNN